MPAIKDVRLEFSRSGGCTVRFDANVWRMSKPPVLVGAVQFKLFAKPVENEVLHLAPGKYKLIGIASVLRNVSPAYAFSLTLAGEEIAVADDEVAPETPEMTPEQIKYVHSFEVKS